MTSRKMGALLISREERCLYARIKWVCRAMGDISQADKVFQTMRIQKDPSGAIVAAATDGARIHAAALRGDNAQLESLCGCWKLVCRQTEADWLSGRFVFIEKPVEEMFTATWGKCFEMDAASVVHDAAMKMRDGWVGVARLMQDYRLAVNPLFLFDAIDDSDDMNVDFPVNRLAVGSGAHKPIVIMAEVSDDFPGVTVEKYKAVDRVAAIMPLNIKLPDKESAA